MKNELYDQLIEAVKRKAVGYTSVEKVDEYARLDDKLCVVKRKITTKEVPPDMSAIKMLLDEMKVESYADMTEDELKKERIRLLNLLKETENAVNGNQTQY